jgi:tetratricopeptide (TPR) repeat protein
LEIAHELKDRNLESRALNNLAMFEAGVNGDYARAHDYYRETLDLAHMIGDRNAESFALANLGFAAGMLGNFPEANDYLENALVVARENGNVYNQVYILTNLSANTAIQNQASLARQYAQSAIDLSQKVGDPSGEAWGYLYLGHAQLLLDQIAEARSAFTRSVEIREKLIQPALAMEPIAGLVEAELCQGDLEMALMETEKILAHINGGGTLNGTDEPLRVYYNCFRLLEKKQDPRSTQVLQMGIQLLQAQISKFKDVHSRKMYIENVPWRFALQEAGKKAGLF